MCLQGRKASMLCSPFHFLEVLMDAVISRLSELDVHDAVFIVADCIDSGRLSVLIDYINAREALYKMEVETYVR